MLQIQYNPMTQKLIFRTPDQISTAPLHRVRNHFANDGAVIRVLDTAQNDPTRWHTVDNTVGMKRNGRRW